MGAGESDVTAAEFDTLADRKARGAFFTPPAIANYLADWAVRGDPSARVLDPTCGEAVFLLAAARKLKALGRSAHQLEGQVFGVDLHAKSLEESKALLRDEGLDADLVRSDFFKVKPPGPSATQLPMMDAVIGNPPFIRYQEHSGENRRLSAKAALAQGVRLSGMASSWAALVVHACAFLKPEGRLAMVLPAELLTVYYAEPIRRWLRQRFASVHLVMFEQLQFDSALERVVLVVARGSGGCDAFSLHYLHDADDLGNLHAFDSFGGAPSEDGKWTDLWLSSRQRQLFKKVAAEHFVPLASYGSPELGTVTGSNEFFAISEERRAEYGLEIDRHVTPLSPPGTKHLRGLSFTQSDWRALRDRGESVWLLHPAADDQSKALRRYVRHGESIGVEQAYKCQVRSPWWRPPMVAAPDLFFTYMSHRYPRLITNSAKTAFVNSMHGIRLKQGVPTQARHGLPLLVLNCVTMLGAEVHGRAYGGGVLKMEPREAASLPMPRPDHLVAAWKELQSDRQRLDRQLRDGRWTNVAKRVEDVLLRKVMGLSAEERTELHDAASLLRERRIGS